MSVSAVTRVFHDAAIPGITDIGTPTATISSDANRDYPNLTPAESAKNAAAAGAKKTANSSDPLTNAAGGALGKQAFLHLLVQEMTNQDPLKPADNTQFISQLAQFSTLEQMQNLNDGFTRIQTAFQAAQARGLLGVLVHAVDSQTGDIVDGVVDQILMDSTNGVRVDVEGRVVRLEDILNIGAGLPPATPAAPPAPLPGTVVPPATGGP